MPLTQDLLSIGFDYKQTEADAGKVLASLRQVLDLAKKFEGLKAGFNTAGFAPLIKNNEDYAKTLLASDKILKQHNQTISDNTKAVETSEKAKQAQLKTAREVIKNIEAAEKAEQQALKTKQENIRTGKLEENQIRKTSKAKQDANDIPFTHNLSPTGAVIQPSVGKTTGTVVNDLDKAQAEAAISATAFGNAEKKLAVDLNVTKKSAEQLRFEEERNLKIRIEEKLLSTQRSAQLKNQVREENAVKGSLEQRRAALIRLNNVFDNQSPSDRASASGQRLQKILGGLSEQVKTLESDTNRHQRNVGNYPDVFEKASNAASGFGKSVSKAYSFVRVAANIIPGLGISGIFLLAYEAIVKVVEELDLFGKKTSKVSEEMQKLKDESGEFEKSLSGVKSGALTTGIELQSFVDIARNGKLPLEERNEALKAANKILGEHGEKLTLVNINTIAVTEEVKKFTDALVAQALAAKYADRIADLFISRADAVDRYNKKVLESKKIEGEAKGLQGNNARDITTVYNELIKKQQEVSEESNQYKFIQEEITKLTSRLNTEQLKSIGLFTDLGTKEKESTKNTKEKKDALSEMYEQLELIDKKQVTGLLGDTKADEERIKAITQAIEELLKTGANESTPIIKELLIKLNPISLRLLEDQIKEFTKKISKEEKIEIPVEIKPKPAEDETKAYEKSIERRLRANATAFANEQIQQQELYSNGEINRENYEKKLLDISEKYGKEALTIQIEEYTAEAKFAFRGVEQTQETEDKKAEIYRKIADLRKLLGEEEIKTEEKTNIIRLQKLSEFFEHAQRLVNDLGDVIGSAIDVGVSREKNNLKEIEDERQKNYEREVDRIKNSTDIESVKADKLKILEAGRMAEKEKNARKERELDVRKAKFDKAANIANIITGTILAVINTLKDPKLILTGANIPLAIAIGALGAAKLAIAIAAPIPKYAKGIADKQTDGFGIAGEDGPEAIHLPGKKPFIVERETLIYMPKHTKVQPLKGNEINQMMYKAMAIQTSNTLMQKAEKDHSTEYLKEIVYELRNSKNKEIKNTLRVLNNNRWEKWNTSINREVRGK